MNESEQAILEEYESSLRVAVEEDRRECIECYQLINEETQTENRGRCNDCAAGDRVVRR